MTGAVSDAQSSPGTGMSRSGSVKPEFARSWPFNHEKSFTRNLGLTSPPQQFYRVCSVLCVEEPNYKLEILVERKIICSAPSGTHILVAASDRRSAASGISIRHHGSRAAYIYAERGCAPSLAPSPALLLASGPAPLHTRADSAALSLHSHTHAHIAEGDLTKHNQKSTQRPRSRATEALGKGAARSAPSPHMAPGHRCSY